MTTEGSGPAITPRTRARARHILDHYYIGPARDAVVLEIWGYTPRMTYAPGDEVVLHVSTTAERWSYEVGRDGSRYEPVDSDDLPDGVPIKNRTRFRELTGRDSDLIPDSFLTSAVPLGQQPWHAFPFELEEMACRRDEG